MNEIDVRIWLDDGAYMPTKSHESDGGIDLRAPEYVYDSELNSVVIDTGVHMVIPEGYAGIIVGRSGLHMRNTIDTQGLVDAGYTGTIKVRLHRDGDMPFDFSAGDRIAQIVIVEVPRVNLVLDYVSDGGVRGDNGFGSTGR